MGRHQKPRSRVREAVLGNLAEFGRAIAVAAVTACIAVTICYAAVRLAETGQRDTAVITAVLELAILVDLLIEWGVSSVRTLSTQDASSRRLNSVEVAL